MFYYIFIAIWAFDLFFYSTTEVFLIFSIFSFFFIFFFLIFSAYLDYLNELIVLEKYNIYTKLYILKYKFVSVLSYINNYSSSTSISNNQLTGHVPLQMYTSAFFKACFQILFSKFQFINYLKFFKFTKINLVNIYKIEFYNIKNQILLDFSTNFGANYISNDFYVNYSEELRLIQYFVDPYSNYLFENFSDNSNFSLLNTLPIFLFKEVLFCTFFLLIKKNNELLWNCTYYNFVWSYAGSWALFCCLFFDV